MSHIRLEDEVHPRSGCLIYGEAVARFACRLEGWDGPLVPPCRGGLGLPPEVARRGDPLRRAKAAVRRFVEERGEVTRLRSPRFGGMGVHLNGTDSQALRQG